MKNDPQLVVLVHGWLSRPGTFGRLPKILRERGHDVLPLFHRFDSWSRAVTLEELAERFEACLARERRGRPTVLVAHSMGGLVALTWMLRHHVEKGRRPPVERLVTLGTPRHGVWLQPLARAFVDWGLVPGTALARQMRAPNPFLWDLAWSELRHAAALPPVFCGAGRLRRPNPVTVLVGGCESDGVVPTVCAQPNAVFISSDGALQALPSRVFRVFPGRAHTGPRGLYSGLKAQDHDGRMALLLTAVEGGASGRRSLVLDDAEELRQAVCIVRHRAGAQALLVRDAKDENGIESVAPVSRHKDGLSLFLLSAKVPGGPIGLRRLRLGGREVGFASAGSGKGLHGGQVIYWDARNC